jgi:hypothetical protein
VFTLTIYFIVFLNVFVEFVLIYRSHPVEGGGAGPPSPELFIVEPPEVIDLTSSPAPSRR